MSHHILCVSYDERLLFTRRMLLEQKGYHITAALGFAESLALCGKSGFALFILGHSIPYSDKTKLIRRFIYRKNKNPHPIWRAVTYNRVLHEKPGNEREIGTHSCVR